VFWLRLAGVAVKATARGEWIKLKEFWQLYKAIKHRRDFPRLVFSEELKPEMTQLEKEIKKS
jgi:hypothetical protein